MKSQGICWSLVDNPLSNGWHSWNAHGTGTRNLQTTLSVLCKSKESIWLCDCEPLWTVLQEKYHLPPKLIDTHIEGTPWGNPRCFDSLWVDIQGVPHQKYNLPGRCVGADFVQSILWCSHPHDYAEPSRAWTDSLVPSRGRVGGQQKVNVLSNTDPRLGIRRWHVLISDSMEKLEDVLRDLDESCNKMRLTISVRKTNIMVVGEEQQRQAAREVQLQLAEEPVSTVDEFEHLGSTVVLGCELDREINKRS